MMLTMVVGGCVCVLSTQSKNFCVLVDDRFSPAANGSFNKRCCEMLDMRYMLIYYCSKNKSSWKIYPEVIYL